MIELKMIKGLGPKTIEKLNKKAIYSLKDLIEFYPISYQRFDEVQQSNKITKTGTIVSSISQYRPRSNLTVTNFSILANDDQEYKVTAWNQQFLKFTLKQGMQVEVYGKHDPLKKTITANRVKQVASDNEQNAITSTGKIIPVYSKIPGLNNSKINTLINKALDEYEGHYPYEHSLKQIHKPSNNLELNKAIRTLKFAEFDTYYQQIMAMKKNQVSDEKYVIKYEEKQVVDFVQDLPFTLTDDQFKVINELLKQFNTKQQVKSLILGDVGSGKTIVSIILALAIVSAKKQVAIMVPTELLALQFHEQVKLFLPEVRTELLLGATKKSEKRRIKTYLQTGACQVVVGTQALIEEDVIFKDLGLVIIDEQHRFGVEQRDLLINKGSASNYIYLSATPIPRTLAQTMFGIFDIQQINTKPSERIKVATEIYAKETKKAMMELVNRELELGNQAFFICPLVEENEQIDLPDAETVFLAMEKYYAGKHKVGILHGAMKSIDKEIIMQRFRNKEYDVLVSTTVIEVGIDIPDATCITVLAAEHFGLATLHQLRGRVGRSNRQSYCNLYTNSNLSKSIERLSLMKRYDNGFILAQEDLKMRGQGDFIGIKQSGNPDFKLFDLQADVDIAIEVMKKYED